MQTQEKVLRMDVLREIVGPLTVQCPSLDVEGLGSCFVIGAMGTCAIAITAAHCLDYAATYDIPDRVSSAPSTPFTVERNQRTWNKIELGTTLKHRNVPPFMSLPVEVEEAYYNNQVTDVAFLLLAPNEEYKEISLDKQINLLSKGPSKGEEVFVVGYFETEIQSSHHRESDGRAAFQSISGKFQVVRTKVIDVFENGVRDISWPCFQVDCPFYSGMSGGVVLVQRDSELLAAGMISRDLSLSGSASGAEAFAALIWPALETTFLEKSYQRSDETTITPIRSIMDFIRIGVIKDASI